MTFSFRRFHDPKDLREQYLIEERDGSGQLTRQYRVHGDAEYAQRHIQEQIELAKKAPVRRPNLGVI
jgi:hypothetical protein